MSVERLLRVRSATSHARSRRERRETAFSDEPGRAGVSKSHAAEAATSSGGARGTVGSTARHAARRSTNCATRSRHDLLHRCGRGLAVMSRFADCVYVRTLFAAALRRVPRNLQWLSELGECRTDAPRSARHCQLSHCIRCEVKSARSSSVATDPAESPTIESAPLFEECRHDQKRSIGQSPSSVDRVGTGCAVSKARDDRAACQPRAVLPPCATIEPRSRCMPRDRL